MGLFTSIFLLAGAVPVSAGIKEEYVCNITDGSGVMNGRTTDIYGGTRVTLPKKKDGKRGAKIVKFKVKKDGYVLVGTFAGSYNVVRVKGLLDTSISSKKFTAQYKNNKNALWEYDPNASSRTWETAQTKVTIYRDAKCKQKVTPSPSPKNVVTTTSAASAYLKKGTYYMLIVNQKDTAQKVVTRVCCVPHQTKTKVIKKNDMDLLGANPKNGSSLYKFYLSKKHGVGFRLMARWNVKLDLLDSKKKVLATYKSSSGGLSLCVDGPEQLYSISTEYGNNPESIYYTTLKKGTYYFRVRGEGEHILTVSIN